ncbi:MAG: hypothetical protein QGF59_11875 [Pirellulaceae bacterium]|nr:hypothetical protein [Pirellulaceae bacterium]
MTPESLDIDYCAERLADFVEQGEPRILGPHETDYGFGWLPTISYWIGQRRVHLYDDSKAGVSAFAAEIAEVDTSGKSSARRCHVSSLSEIEDIMQRFLREGQIATSLADYQWIEDSLDSDKFIPDPPNRSNSANFAGFVGGHVAAGGPNEEHIAEKETKPWWRLW